MKTMLIVLLLAGAGCTASKDPVNMTVRVRMEEAPKMISLQDDAVMYTARDVFGTRQVILTDEEGRVIVSPVTAEDACKKRD